jgi:hypothetical protein
MIDWYNLYTAHKVSFFPDAGKQCSFLLDSRAAFGKSKLDPTRLDCFIVLTFELISPR